MTGKNFGKEKSTAEGYARERHKGSKRVVRVFENDGREERHDERRMKKRMLFQLKRAGIELIVLPAFLDKLAVSSFFYDPAVVENDDIVA